MAIMAMQMANLEIFSLKISNEKIITFLALIRFLDHTVAAHSGALAAHFLLWHFYITTCIIKNNHKKAG